MAVSWSVIDHPRVNLIVALILGGAAFLAPRTVGYVLWGLAGLVAVGSLAPRLRGTRLRWPLYRPSAGSLIDPDASTVHVGLDGSLVDPLRAELREWRPDGKASELKALVYRELPNLTIREAEQVWPFLLYIYQNPFTEVSLRPDESNSTGTCLGTIHLVPVSTFTIERPCATASILWGLLEQMVTKVRNEAYSDAKLNPKP